ncbi:MAG: hypothetical protein V7L31_23140 [Nostoc sp.]|uniref:hypothetical protein n=1 Tax=Nostoc sp. TaxID=1180 RepID=UPI002FEF45A9
MYSINQPQYSIDDSEEILVRIGQKVKFFDSQGKVNHGQIVEADSVSNTVKVVIGAIIQYTETVDADNLIEG